MTPEEFAETAIKGALILNPLTAPLVLGGGGLGKLVGLGGKKQEPPKPKGQQTGQPGSDPNAPPSPPPEWVRQLPPGGYADADTNYGSQHQSLPPGAPDMDALIPGLLSQWEEANRRRDAESRKFYPERTRIDLEAWKQREAIARENALERMREKTKRDKELKVIDAWTAVTQSEIQRETALGLGMMNLSATLGMPNPNVLAANANAIAAGVKGFTGAQPVF